MSPLEEHLRIVSLGKSQQKQLMPFSISAHLQDLLHRLPGVPGALIALRLESELLCLTR